MIARDGHEDMPIAGPENRLLPGKSGLVSENSVEVFKSSFLDESGIRDSNNFSAGCRLE